MIACNRLIKSAALLVVTGTLAACGGGGSDSGGQLAVPYTPSVTVQGLAAAEVVSFTLNGDTINASTNGVYTASATVLGNYSAALLTSPAGKTCAFNGAGNTYSGSSPSITLACVINTTPGGGGGTTTPGAQPAVNIGANSHQSFAWTVYRYDPAPLISTLVSLTSFTNVGLTNATTSNFVFYDTDLELQSSPSSEFKIHIEPITVGVVPTKASIAVDISSSLTSAQVTTIRQEVRDFLTGTSVHQFYRLTAFDDQVMPLQDDYTNDVATLQAAADSIPVSEVERSPSTNILGAMSDAATSANRFLEPELDYMVVITDGTHTTDTGTVADVDTETEFQLMFVIAIGDNADLPLLEDLVSPSNEDVDRPARVLRIADVSQVEEALQTVADYVHNMTQGLHFVHYLSPRRGDTNLDFTFESSPLDDCSASSSLFPCKWVVSYDSDTFASDPTLLYVFANAMYPLPEDAVRLTIPDWNLCSPTPNFDWSITENAGSATLSAPSADGRQITVTLGNAPVNDIEVTVTDLNAPTCTNTFSLITPSYTPTP